MAKANIFFTIIVAAITFVLGCLIAGAFFYWSSIKGNFFQVRLFELGQLLSTIAIALFITHFISTKINLNIKKRELLNILLLDYQNKITGVIQLQFDYVGQPTEEKEKKIVAEFKTLGSLLSIIMESRSDLNGLDDKFQFAYFKFKKALTDTPFGQREPTPTFDKERMLLIENSFNIILKMIYDIRIKLFS